MELSDPIQYLTKAMTEINGEQDSQLQSTWITASSSSHGMAYSCHLNFFASKWNLITHFALDDKMTTVMAR